MLSIRFLFQMIFQSSVTYLSHISFQSAIFFLSDSFFVYFLSFVPDLFLSNFTLDFSSFYSLLGLSFYINLSFPFSSFLDFIYYNSSIFCFSFSSFFSHHSFTKRQNTFSLSISVPVPTTLSLYFFPTNLIFLYLSFFFSQILPLFIIQLPVFSDNNEGGGVMTAALVNILITGALHINYSNHPLWNTQERLPVSIESAGCTSGQYVFRALRRHQESLPRERSIGSDGQHQHRKQPKRGPAVVIRRSLVSFSEVDSGYSIPRSGFGMRVESV